MADRVTTRRAIPTKSPKLTQAQVDFLRRGRSLVEAMRANDYFASAPKPMVRAASEIITDPTLSEIPMAIMERADEFRSPETAMLAGIAMSPQARNHMLDRLEGAVMKNPPRRLFSGVPEVVIGGGVHAAIYCAVRARMGMSRPIVITKDFGGAFACSRGATFFLNSRNRPGELAIPGDVRGSLNVFPGSPLQPSDIGGAEFQTNDTLGFITRILLAMHAEVYQGEVGEIIREGFNKLRLNLTDGNKIRAKRVIIATGLSRLRRDIPMPKKSPRMLEFADFMASMDKPFPLRGMKRVAVIGAGDSGKNAIEALTGQGPSGHMSVASLDWPTQIDWYGVPEACRTPVGWAEGNRSRYKTIGRLFPTSDAVGRVTPLKQKARYISDGFNSITVNELPYDLVVLCTGYVGSRPSSGTPFSYRFDEGQGRALGLKAENEETYAIGPCANLPWTDEENLRRFAKVPENLTALFRLAPRTAALAAQLRPAPLAF